MDCPNCGKPLINLQWHGLAYRRQNFTLSDTSDFEDWGDDFIDWENEHTAYWTHHDCGKVIPIETCAALDLLAPDPRTHAIEPPTDQEIES